VAFWYQVEPHKPWPALPPGPQRIPFREEPLLFGWKAVADAKHSDAPLSGQKLPGATDGKQLFFQPTEAKAWIEIPITLDKEVRGFLLLRVCHAADYGVYRVILDGKEIGTVDLFFPTIQFAGEKLGGWQEIKSGAHTLRLECTGKNAASTGYFLGMDLLLLKTPVYSRSSSVDLRTLQKK
jgi:hypothetical protein